MQRIVDSWRPALAALAIVAVMVFVAVPDAAGQTTLPGKPTGTNPNAMSIGDTEVKLAWTAPGTGACAATEYFVRVDKKNTYPGTVFQSFTARTDYTITQNLEASTEYNAEVWSYGSSCDDYSELPLYLAFTTAATSSSSDPTPPSGQEKPAPNAPVNLSGSVSGTTATFNWSHATNTNRCQHTFYRYAFQNNTDDTYVYADILDSNGEADPMADSLELTVVSGKEYTLYLFSYSHNETCNMESHAALAMVSS